MLILAMTPPVLVGVPLFLVALIAFLIKSVRDLKARATAFGFPTRRDYLRAIPATAAERQDAIDLTLQGAVLCLLGLLFGPILILGLPPLYFGSRKLVSLAYGLGPATTRSADV
jgi:hypothetical protein